MIAPNWPIQKFPAGQSPQHPKKSRWSGMALSAKRQWLIDSGQARTWDEAIRLLNDHHRAVREYRKQKITRQKTWSQSFP